LNPPADAPLLAEFAGAGTIEIEGSRVTLDANGDVARIAATADARRADLVFAPPFPNLEGLGAPDTRHGQWSISLNDAVITGGLYRVQRRDQRLEVELDVTRPWVPANMPWAMTIFVWLVPSFRNWPATYRWHGVVEFGATISLRGHWNRK
jgi:hypothetical protein